MHVADVGGDVQPLPGFVTVALINEPPLTFTVAVDPVHPLLKLVRNRVPVPDAPAPMLVIGPTPLAVAGEVTPRLAVHGKRVAFPSGV